MIPFAGSAIDQITFGLKDALSNEELRNIVVDISSELAQHKLMGESLSASNIEQICEKLFQNPKIQRVVRQLETVGTDTSKALAIFTSGIDRHSAKLDETAIAFNAAVAGFGMLYKQALKDLEHSREKTQEQYERIVSELTSFEDYLNRIGEGERRDLDQIRHSIEATDFSSISATADSILKADKLAKDIHQINISWLNMGSRELSGKARCRLIS